MKVFERNERPTKTEVEINRGTCRCYFFVDTLYRHHIIYLIGGSGRINLDQNQAAGARLKTKVK